MWSVCLAIRTSTTCLGLDPSQIGTQPTLKFDNNECTKALGVSWEPGTDQLRFDSTPDISSGPPTKRSILSAVSKHFDPLGLTAPVIIRAKILLQELWLQPCGWDEEVSDTIRAKWDSYRIELPRISSYRTDRYALLPNSTVQLHTFADASQQAYGACIYARSTDTEGRTKVQLMASKSRVAPLKRISLPRLELSAAVIAARLHQKVVVALDMPISESHFWSDSTVTLEWLRSPPYTWNTFVANRVSEIQNITQGSRWHHVAGKHNPADLITRGMKVDDFLGSELWHRGPSWLEQPETEWPVTAKQQNTPEDVLERREMVAAIQNKPEANPIFSTSSSYNRLTRVTAYCLRFINACRRKTSTSSQPELESITKSITVDEMSIARMRLIKLAQADAFTEEISCTEQATDITPSLKQEGLMGVSGTPTRAISPIPDRQVYLLHIADTHIFKLIVAKDAVEKESSGSTICVLGEAESSRERIDVPATTALEIEEVPVKFGVDTHANAAQH
nr:uncharacterized protein LOC115268204 [Aedes albopictus]